LRYLGTVKTTSAKGTLIVKGEFAPAIGTKVITNRLETIGHVKEILGPVKNPYLIVNPANITGRKLLALIGCKLYTR
jgi:rRNA processing protein Gar1